MLPNLKIFQTYFFSVKTTTEWMNAHLKDNIIWYENGS